MSARVVILGGGVSGLGMAWALAGQGVSVDVLESEPIVGGLARTIRDDGCCLDLGPHSFFSEDEGVLRKVLALFDEPLEPSPRRVKFLYRGKYLDYPLTPRSVMQMGPGPGIRIAASALRQKLLPYRSPTMGTPVETVEDWAISSFGRHLFEEFFKPYTEQFWKVPCTELSSRSIPSNTRMSFTNTLRVLLSSATAEEDPSLVEREMLPTYYPRTGFGEVPERIAAAVRAAGGRVHVGCRALEVCGNGGGMRVVYERGGIREEMACTQVVSTIPLNALAAMLRPSPDPETLAAAQRLEYRALVVLGMVTQRQDILGCGYVYVLNRPYNRVSEMNEFSAATSPQGENTLSVEIPCFVGSPLWNAGAEEVFDLCSASLAADGLLLPGDVKRLLLARAPAAYPVYRKDYAEHLERVQRYLAQRNNVWSLGRCGELMYMDIDKCLARAFALAERILPALAVT